MSLSANQVSLAHRMFAILKPTHIKAGKWTDYDCKEDSYEVIVNPELIGETQVKFKDFEECPSLPGLRFAIWNPISQKYAYDSPIVSNGSVQFKREERTLSAFIARLWDH